MDYCQLNKKEIDYILFCSCDIDTKGRLKTNSRTEFKENGRKE